MNKNKLLLISLGGLFFVAAGALTICAAIYLGTDDVQLPEAEAMPVSHTLNYTEDFDTQDPFKFWASNGSYTTHYKGITKERSSSGSSSFKIDITFNTATYLYLRIPIMVPSEGELTFKGDIILARNSEGSASLGTNFSLSPCPYSGVNIIEKITTAQTQWKRQESDLAAKGQTMAQRLLNQYCAGAGINDTGIWTNSLGLFLFGETGTRLTVYVDNIRLTGAVPDETDYEQYAARLWQNYTERTDAEIQTFLMEINNFGILDGDGLITAIADRGFPTPDEYDLLMSTAADIKYEIEKPDDDIILYPWDAMGTETILPFSDPVHAFPGTSLAIAACRGEYEPASFIIKPQKDIRKIIITTSELTGNNGAVIPASHLDIRLVKCWYQAGRESIKNNGERELVPELLLKNDALIRVDHDTKTNYIKACEETGSPCSYIDISSKDGVIPQERMVTDAKELQPFSLAEGYNKQVWITVHVPWDAPSGDYIGNIHVNTDEGKSFLMELNLEVLPFELSEPILDYTLYYRGKRYSGNPEELGSEWKTRQQYKAELGNMKRHGVLNQTVYQPLDALIEEVMNLRFMAGLNRDKLFVFDTKAGDQAGADALAKLKSEVVQWQDIAARHDYDEVYIYGIDEASGAELLSEMNAWQQVNMLGAKMFVACYSDAVGIVGDSLDLAVLGGGGFYPSIVDQWHDRGKPVYAYGNPQVGIEDPALYRSNYGFRLYASGYDGVMDYAYQHGFGHIWNDFDHEEYRDHVFAYPTSDGVVDTIQWEGFREAVDDIRYLTTLFSLLSEAESSQVNQWLQSELNSSNDPPFLRHQIIEAIGLKQ